MKSTVVPQENTLFSPTKSIDMTILDKHLVKSNKMFISNQFNKFIDTDRKDKWIRNSTGQQLTDFDGTYVGSLFKLNDFQSAQIPAKFVMPIIRSIDPIRDLVEAGIWPVSGKLQFVDCVRMRVNTRIGETIANVFVTTLTKNKSPYIIIDSLTYYNNLTKRCLLERLIDSLQLNVSNYKMLIIMLCIKNIIYVLKLQEWIYQKH
jgi:hypothetical protein